MQIETTPFNPFTGKNPDEVWRELHKIAVPVDRVTAMKQIEEIIKERKAQAKK